MALYTGKGDQGTTKVIDSKDRFSKSSDHAEALGSLDELNSYLGHCKVKTQQAQNARITVGKTRYYASDLIHEVQMNLFIVQAEVAGAQDKKMAKRKLTKMEQVIHAAEGDIPPLSGFTVAGGSEVSAMLDVARTMARRTERRVIAVHDQGIRKLSKHSLAYCNRLSSLLFALARLTNAQSGITEPSPDYR